jgi:hypothetical protein
VVVKSKIVGNNASKPQIAITQTRIIAPSVAHTTTVPIAHKRLGKMAMFNDDKKGNTIHITGSKYVKTSVEAWCQVGKDDLDMFSHIIIKLKNGKEVRTRIKKDNVGAPYGPPMNCAEAGLQQNININDDFNKV